MSEAYFSILTHIFSGLESREKYLTKLKKWYRCYRQNYSKKKLKAKWLRNYRDKTQNENNLFNSVLFIQTIKKKVFLFCVVTIKSGFWEYKTKGQTILNDTILSSKRVKVQINTWKCQNNTFFVLLLNKWNWKSFILNSRKWVSRFTTIMEKKTAQWYSETTFWKEFNLNCQ